MDSKILSLIGAKRNIPKVDFKDYSGLLQGTVKIGKSTFAALIPQTIVVSFEKGVDDKVVDTVDCTGEDGWLDFIEFLDKLEDNREAIGNEIKLIAIDTVETAYEATTPYMLKKEGIKDGKVYKSIGDIPHGKGYVAKDEYFKEQIKRIYNLGFRPLYITHVAYKTIRPKNPNEQPYEVLVPTIPDRLSAIITPEVSYILHMKNTVVDGEKTRVLQLLGTEEIEAGSRVHIDHDIPFDTEQEAVEKFSEAWEEVIAQRLRKAGIKDDIDHLKAKQDEERINTALENLKKPNSSAEFSTPKDLSDYVKTLIADKKITQKRVVKILKDQGYEGFNDISPEDLDTLAEIIRKEID